MTILTLSQAKSALAIESDRYDGDLVDYIDATTAAVDHLCGPSDPETVTQTRRASGAIVLLKTPALTLTSITGQRYGALVLSDLWLESGVVRPRYGAAPIYDDVYEVIYTAGRESVPMALVQGARVILKHQWETRRGTPKPGISTDETTLIPGLGYAVPNRALQIMAGYLRGPSVA